jgi:hypothetical protein
MDAGNDEKRSVPPMTKKMEKLIETLMVPPGKK